MRERHIVWGHRGTLPAWPGVAAAANIQTLQSQISNLSLQLHGPGQLSRPGPGQGQGKKKNQISRAIRVVIQMLIPCWDHVHTQKGSDASATVHFYQKTIPLLFYMMKS